MHSDAGSAARPDATALRERFVTAARSRAGELTPQPSPLTTHGSFRSAPRALLFDVYGTLLISVSGDIGTAESAADEALFAESMQAVLAPGAAEAAPAAREAYFAHIRNTHRRLRERGVEQPEVDIRAIWREVLHDLLNSGALGPHSVAVAGLEAAASQPEMPGAGGAIPEDLPEKLALEYELRANPVWPMPGAEKVLKAARARGMPMGIVSNAQFFTPIVLEALFGQSLRELGFIEELCAWSYRVGVAKPATQIFEPVVAGLASRYGLRSIDVLYIGNDLYNDVLPASQLGLQTALFAGDGGSLRLRADSLAEAPVRPDLVIAHWDDLSSMLEREDR